LGFQTVMRLLGSNPQSSTLFDATRGEASSLVSQMQVSKETQEVKLPNLPEFCDGKGSMGELLSKERRRKGQVK
jgi:hypothetical protein